MTNWLFALPAVKTIDTFGRRNLLLTTFPLMGICLLFCGFSFYIPDNADGSVSDARIGCVATAIFLFMMVYSPGEGPVPFTYSAEAFPLYIRDTGMSFATATTWGFNFILSLTWPALVEAFDPQGAFGWYAAWNFFGWVYCYFLLPETKVSSAFGTPIRILTDRWQIESHSRRTGHSLLCGQQGACPVLHEEATLVLEQVHSQEGCAAFPAAVPVPR